MPRTAMTMNPAISLKSLTKTFPGGVAALTDLTLDVPPGSVFGFLGPNGAGKTTTIKIVAGLSRASSGSMTVAGIPSEAGIRYRREIGYLAEAPRFYDWMTARETLRYAARFEQRIDEPLERRIDELLDLVGLREARDRRSGELSAGMRQRLGVAQALIGRPSVLLLDEPASALDPIGRREILGLMDGLRGTATVFYSTHILDDVERVADHVAILARGRLVTVAPTADLLARFTRGGLRVVVVGGADDLPSRLARLPGVIEAIADPAPPDPGAPGAEAGGDAVHTMTVRTSEQAVRDVQRAITQMAAAEDLILAENRPVVLDLETVFLQLVGDGGATA